MEIAEYLGRIWRRKWIVLIITVLAVIVNVVVAYATPRQFRATSVMEVGGVQALLGNPGQARESNSRQTLPSSVQAVTQTYLNLLATPVVDNKAKERVETKLAYEPQGNGAAVDGTSDMAPSAPGATSNVNFTYEGRGQPIRDSNTDMIYIDAFADDPAVAKAAADALAQVLLEQGQKMGGDTASDFVNNIQKEQINPINTRLAEIRAEVESLKLSTGIDEAARNIRIADLEDEALALEDTRKQYTDIVATVRVNEALDQNTLRIISMAATPAAKESPQLVRSSAVAGIAGLVIGLLAVLVIDRRKQQNQPATIF